MTSLLQERMSKVEMVGQGGVASGFSWKRAASLPTPSVSPIPYVDHDFSTRISSSSLLPPLRSTCLRRGAREQVCSIQKTQRLRRQ